MVELNAVGPSHGSDRLDVLMDLAVGRTLDLPPAGRLRGNALALYFSKSGFIHGGTGSYGAALCRYLEAENLQMGEVNRPGPRRPPPVGQE